MRLFVNYVISMSVIDSFVTGKVNCEVFQVIPFVDTNICFVVFIIEERSVPLSPPATQMLFP